MLRITSTSALSTPNLSEFPVNWLNLLKKVLNGIESCLNQRL
jgi:hypothetical protein